MTTLSDLGGGLSEDDPADDTPADDAEPDDTTHPAERPAWQPNAAPRNRCLNCGDHITKRAARVMGDERDRVHHCTNCMPNRDLQNGAAHNPDYDPETDRMRSTRTGNNSMDGDGE